MAGNAQVSFRLAFNNLPAISAALKLKLGEVVDKTAHEIEGNAKASLAGSKSGKVYERRGRSHQASAPGEAPANDYGALGNSIQTQNTGQLSRLVSVGAEHGAVLETGGAKVAARPFMGPAAEQARPGFEAAVRAVVDRPL